jgi:hypothetical protein
MSTTDLLNGPENSLPTYNIKDNPSIFNAIGNSVQKINRTRSYLLAIAYNAPNFLNIILDYRNLSRSYYNQMPKKFCSTVRFSGVQHQAGKQSTVYLPSPGGLIPNSIPYVEYNGTTEINLMKVLGQNQLPTQWSNVIKNNGNPLDISVFNPATLTDQEKVLYYYIKHADFFTKMLDLMTRSYYNWSIQRYETWVAVFPEDLYPGTKEERTVLLTGEFLKAVYSQYLRESRYGNKLNFQLPCPRVINPNYIVPLFNLTKGQLVRYINGNSNSFPI